MTEEIRDAAPATGGPGAPENAPPDASEPTAETAPAEPRAATSPQPGPEVGPEAPDYKDRWLRTEAELQNFRRRAVRDREDAVRMSEDRLLLELIELLDDLERALAALTPEQAAESWSQGVALTAQRMRDTLARRGVRVMDCVGKPFDPAFHEALLEVPAPEGVAPGAVVQEVQKGYARGERALRAARVMVARTDG